MRMTREQGIKRVFDGPSHVVILGAGASIASTTEGVWFFYFADGAPAKKPPDGTCFKKAGRRFCPVVPVVMEQAESRYRDWPEAA